ncbi:MAG: beta strand repeat-containing protein [Acidimicrobiales bacterium]
MRKSPLWFRRLLVGGVSTLTVGGLGFAGLLTAGAAGATSAFTINSVSGANRFATAAAIAAKAFPSGAPTVIVASGVATNLPDSLASSYLAAQQNGGKGAPILLTNPNNVPRETAQAILSLKATKIIIVGGTAAVSASVETTLTNNGAITVSRVAGSNRFLTADAVDTQTGSMNIGPKKTVIIADGLDANLVDSLGASPLAYAGPYPLVLVNGPTGTLTAAELATLKTDGITDAVLVGGSAAIGSQVATQLSGVNITPHQEAGPNRSATSETLANYEIANYGFSDTSFNVASGDQGHIVDSLSGGPLGGSETPPAPTLITLSVDNAGSAADFATAHSATETSANIFGGSAAVDSTAEAAILAAGKGTGTGAVTNLPQLTGAKVLSTDAALGSTVQYTFSKPVLSATAADFKLYLVDGTASVAGSSATVQTGGTTVNVVFAAQTMTTGTGGTNVNNYTLATVASGAVTTSTGTKNPDGSAAIGSSSTTTLTPGKTDAPNLTTVGNFRAGAGATAGDTLVDFTFDTAPTLVGGAGNFGLVSTTGATDVVGTGTPVVSGDTVTVPFAGTVAASSIARGYIAANTVKSASNSDMNPVQAAAVSGGGLSTNADLVSATLEPTTHQVLYTFDQAVTGTPNPTDFGLFYVDGTQKQGATTATIGGPGNVIVLVDFTGDSFVNIVGANVITDMSSNYSADSFGVVGSGSGQTSGMIDAPQLTGVALSKGVLNEQATYTFSQPFTTAPTATDYHLYTATGTETTGSTCTNGTAGINGITTVVCTMYKMGPAPGTGTAATPAGTEVLGTVDAGAVTGSTAPDDHANPEGAANTTSS